jgi:hypothetical protein
MKLFTIILLFFALKCDAQDRDFITTKLVFERKATDGKPACRVETVSRGKTILFHVSYTIEDGLTNTSRSYMFGKEIVMSESDSDGDGIFETFSLYNLGKCQTEVFYRERNGSVQPVSPQSLATFKKQHAEINELWTQKKIRGAEKKRNNESK